MWLRLLESWWWCARRRQKLAEIVKPSRFYVGPIPIQQRPFRRHQLSQAINLSPHRSPIPAPYENHHGWRSCHFPRSQSQILASTSSPPQPRRIPHWARINTDNMAQSKGGTAISREGHHNGQKEHWGEQEKSNLHIFREYSHINTYSKRWDCIN